MKFLNEYEIDSMVTLFGGHPVLAPAVQTLVNLKEWANRNSDGWAHWPKPARAARALMVLLDDEKMARYRHERDRKEATAADVKKALAPIKAFRTRQKATFEIVEPA